MSSEPAWINRGIGETVGTATVTAATDVLSLVSHGLEDGDLVMVDSLTGGADGPLVEGAVYHVRNAATDEFQLSATRGGHVVDFASDGGADVHAATPAYNAAELRRLLGGLLQRGDASGGFAARSGLFPSGSETTPNHAAISGTTWTVQNITGVIHTGLTSQTGPYLFAHPEESGSTTAADGSSDRIDALDLQIQDHDEDSSGFRRARVVYVDGTAGSGVAAAVTANSVRIATILVPAGGSPAPTLTVVAPFTVAKGGIIPVPSPDGWPGSGGRYRGMALWDISLEMLLINENAGSNYIPGSGMVRLAHVSLSGTVGTGTDLEIPAELRGLFRSYTLQVNAGITSETNRRLVVLIAGDTGANYRANARADNTDGDTLISVAQNNEALPQVGYLGGFAPGLAEITYRPGSLGNTGTMAWSGHGWANNGASDSTIWRSGGRWNGSSTAIDRFTLRTAATGDSWTGSSEATLWGHR